MRKCLFNLFILICAITLSACHSSENKNHAAPVFKNIGNFHHAITTKSPLAQQYFDQGLSLLYSFEFGEAIRSFKAAIQNDPECAMCYWGLAFALGSKTDMPITGNELVEAQSNIKLAQKNLNPTNFTERLYIAALAKRYENVQTTTLEPFAGLCSSYTQVAGDNLANYANAMEQVVSFLPDDPDAKTLYVASLFDRYSWNFWSREHASNTNTDKMVRLLEAVIKTHPDHPGANHLYVHIIEGSPYPERALTTASRLGQLVPVSQHMTHMPAHTYYSLGRYHDSTLANQQAIEVYKQYVDKCKTQGFQPEIQYLYYHNIDYLAIAASMEGRKQLALSAANDLAKEITPYISKTLFLQKMLTQQILMRARFGEWDVILQLQQPQSEYQYATGIWLYARGLAETQRSDLKMAEQYLQALREIVRQGATEKNLNKPGYILLQIAMYTLQAVIDGKHDRSDAMMHNLQKAVALQDEVDSFDPPPWYFPVRELLGNALLKIKHYQEAKQIFMADLKKHPKNPWSLYGLYQSELALGNRQSVNKIKKEFRAGWVYADIAKPIYPAL